MKVKSKNTGAVFDAYQYSNEDFDNLSKALKESFDSTYILEVGPQKVDPVLKMLFNNVCVLELNANDWFVVNVDNKLKNRAVSNDDFKSTFEEVAV